MLTFFLRQQPEHFSSLCRPFEESVLPCARIGSGLAPPSVYSQCVTGPVSRGGVRRTRFMGMTFSRRVLDDIGSDIIWSQT